MTLPLRRAITKRRMIRAFSPEPLDPTAVDELLDLARRAPSAGNTQAVRFVVLDSPQLVSRYWNLTLPPGRSHDGRDRRSGFRWQQLLDAPALILVTVEPERYLARYAEPDKVAAGRGDSIDRWPVPYWWVDAGAVIQNLLLLCTEAGLGACLFGPFDHEPVLKSEFGVPAGARLAATVAIGHPLPDQPGRSSHRPRPPIDQIIVRPPRPSPPDDAEPS